MRPLWYDLQEAWLETRRAVNSTRNPKSARTGTDDSPKTGPKTGEPCAQVGKDPNTPEANGQPEACFRIHLYVMFTRLSARPGPVQ